MMPGHWEKTTWSFNPVQAVGHYEGYDMDQWSYPDWHPYNWDGNPSDSYWQYSNSEAQMFYHQRFASLQYEHQSACTTYPNHVPGPGYLSGWFGDEDMWTYLKSFRYDLSWLIDYLEANPDTFRLDTETSPYVQFNYVYSNVGYGRNSLPWPSPDIHATLNVGGDSIDLGHETSSTQYKRDLSPGVIAPIVECSVSASYTEPELDVGPITYHDFYYCGEWWENKYVCIYYHQEWVLTGTGGRCTRPILCVNIEYWVEDEPVLQNIETLNAKYIHVSSATIGGKFTTSDDTHVEMGIQWRPKGATSWQTYWWAKSPFYIAWNLTFWYTMSGLNSSRTYYYRAFFRKDGEYTYGSEKSFTTAAIPVVFKYPGTEYRTAKQALDDVMKLSVGRYYTDAQGDFEYESRFRRND